MRIAVIGLGIIGSRAAANLSRNPDHEVRMWNRTPKGLSGEARSLEEAAGGAEVICLYLKDREAVREVLPKLENCVEQTTLLNHSTIDLETTQWVAEHCASRGWSFLDAPFTGSRDAAGGGKLVYYAGGEAGLVESLKPLLLETAKEVIHTGAIGSATVVKLVTNLISACTVQALSESLATAQKHGVPPEVFINAVNSNACGSVLSGMKLPSMVQSDFTTHFSLENMYKDSRYALDLAEGMDTPAICAVSSRMGELCREGLGDMDYSALAAAYQKA